jgi:hypothetical protein
MNNRELIEKLSAEYTVHVRTEYHIQIETKNGPHDLWFTKGRIKFSPCGYNGWRYVTPNSLFKALERYDYEKTDLAAMRTVTGLISRIGSKTGIFVDAGWTKEAAKIAVVKIEENGDLDISVRSSQAESNTAAELEAIRYAADLHPTDEPIFTDCLPVVRLHARAVWIPREQNKHADKFGNVRKPKTGDKENA